MTEIVAGGLAADLAQALSDTLDPVKKHLETIEKQIAEKETELAELREVRNIAARIVRTVDPDAAPAKTPGKKTPGGSSYGVSPETAREALVVIRKHYTPEDDLVASDMARNAKLQAALPSNKSQSGISRTLLELQNQGLIRLDRLGVGGKKFFRLIDEGSQNGKP